MDMTVKHTTLIIYTIFLGMVLNMLVFAPPPAKAAQPTMPVHNISMEFDLQTNSLKANSRIELPANVNLELDYSHLAVSRITVNGQQVEITPGSAALNLPASSRDREILLTYTKEIRPGTSPYNMISENGITLIDSWYPVADREMLFKLTAFIPVEFDAVSEADEIITFQVNSRKQMIFRFPHPLFSIDFIAGPYVVTRENFGNENSLAAYFFPEDRELADGYLAKTRQYLERYTELLGPYPYDRFAVVENRLPTGFAMPTFTLLGQAVVRLPFIVDTSLGHEVLHAWFGNGVRLSPREGNWIEGLTTYLADQSFAADEGRGAAYRKSQLVKYQSYVRPEMNLILRNFNNVGHENVMGQPVRAVGYNKSSMVFHMLRSKLGPDAFTAALQDFYKRFRYKTAGWSDLKTSFERISGMDLDTFFTQWLDRNDVPLLAVESPEITNTEGHPVLQFDLVQKNDQPYVLDVPIVIKTALEEIHKTLPLSKSRGHFEIPLAALPESLVIDPEYDLMRTLAPAELPPTWSRFLGSEHKVAILPSEKDKIIYKPLLDELQEYEGSILIEDEVSDKDLANNSLLFLGTAGRLSRSLFAQPDHPASAFTLDVRNNPLDPDQVAVLVTAPDAEQVAAAAGKLRHYGKYSYLSFKNGRIQEKNIAATDDGMIIELAVLPAGIKTSQINSFGSIIADLFHKRIIYIGENHTSYEDHLLQLEIIRALYEEDPRLAIGMEMFTRPYQAVLDRYLAGETDEKTFLKESHYFKTWRFDYRLYRDIINFAKHNHIPVIALNLEQNIVNQVFKGGGTGSLDQEEASLLPPDRKLDAPGYRERIESAYMMHAGRRQNDNFSGFLQAQALWDETMAETIAGYLQDHPDERMAVIAGRGHVDRRNAIPPRVERRLPVSQAVVVNSTGSANQEDTADYVFFSPPAGLPPLPLLGVILEGTENGEGVLVTALTPQGPAKEAGVREKDIILAIDSEPVNDIEDVKIAMLYKEKKDAVTVRIRRSAFLFGRKELEIKIPLKSAKNPHHM